MKELLVRALSGAVLVSVIIACIFVSPWTCWALAMFIVGVGAFEMYRLMRLKNLWQLVFGEVMAVGVFAVFSLGLLNHQATSNLMMLLPMAPFLLALFSTTDDFKSVASYHFAVVALLSLPCFFMLCLRELYGPRILLLAFVLIWVNDTFAYLTGRLLGKHKLFERISPGKTIEGSIGGLVFTMVGVAVFGHYADWLPMKAAIGMGLIAAVMGTLGDLCESMLKRQAGVKDSGRLIPGHGGILDRFDSNLFSLPFYYIYLLFVL